jgi:hypothetical protein
MLDRKTKKSLDWVPWLSFRNGIGQYTKIIIIEKVHLGKFRPCSQIVDLGGEVFKY